jgi:hypothetical protein
MSDCFHSAGADFSVRPLSTWSDLIGNEDARRVALRVLRYSGPTPKMMLAGPSGSGKSTTINHVCRTGACYQPRGDEPCLECKGCREFKVGERVTGLFAQSDWENPCPFHYLPLNCRNITPTVLHHELETIRHETGLRVIHLEEAASLKRLGCDESITDIMDDPAFSTCRWFATCVTDGELDQQFRRRWNVKMTTSPPSGQELAQKLAKECRRLNIDIDHPSTWELLARRSWRVVGWAMAPLAVATLREPRQLTKQIVEDYPFPGRDPWRSTSFTRN